MESWFKPTLVLSPISRASEQFDKEHDINGHSGDP